MSAYCASLELLSRWRSTPIPILIVCRPLTMLRSSYTSSVAPISSSSEVSLGVSKPDTLTPTEAGPLTVFVRKGEVP